MKYAMNIKDLRVVAATCETMKQPDYREISEKTAIAIAKGEMDAAEVAKELLFGKRVAPLPVETKQAVNVRTKALPDTDKDEDNTPVEPPVVEPPPAVTAEALDAMNVPQLKVMAAELKIDGYAKLNKDELKAAILGNGK
jgi:hypothetical protein